MKTLLTLILAGLSALGFAQTVIPLSGQGFGWNVARDFHTNQNLALVSYSVNAIPNAFGIKGLNLLGVGFGGSTLTSSAQMTGGAGIGIGGKIGNVTIVAAAGEGVFQSGEHFIGFLGLQGNL